jgi:hypothetical protein
MKTEEESKMNQMKHLAMESTMSKKRNTTVDK